MKKTLIIVFFLLPIVTRAQTLTPAHFKGGESAFQGFLKKNLKYPFDTVGSRIIPDIARVGFVVEKDGRLTGIHIVKPLDESIYDDEVLRVIARSPKWVPATRNGVSIRSNYTVPIQFLTPVFVFKNVDDPAVFRGGPVLFNKYVDSCSAKILRSGHRYGTVVAGVIVTRTGRIAAPKIIRGLSPETDSAAVYILENSPLWKPGSMEGRPVNSSATVAVSFRRPRPLQIVRKPDVSLLKDADITIEVPVETNSNLNADPNLIYTSVEKVPKFPGGMEGFASYIKKNLKWPEKPREVEGRVILTFVVEKDGSLTGIKVVRSIAPELDAEAVRLLKASPRWTPGIRDGKAVRVQYAVPIQFKTNN